MSETTDNARESAGEVMQRFVALEQRLADIERRFFPTVANHADFIDRANSRLHGIERRLDRLDERITRASVVADDAYAEAQLPRPSS